MITATLYTQDDTQGKSIEIRCFEDIQKAVGGFVAMAKLKGEEGDVLCDEDGLMKKRGQNAKFPSLVGDVLVAPKAWTRLPFNKGENK